MQLLPFSHVRLHVRRVAQVKSQTCPARHTQLFPQRPFDGPTAPSSFVPPVEEDDEEEEEVAPLLVTVPEVDDGVTVPASPSVPVFQSKEHPKTRENPALTTSGMTRRGLTAP